MTDFPKATRITAKTRPPVATVLLGYDERFLRRKRLVTTEGRGVLVDLPETISLNAGDCLETTAGDLIEVVAAEEDVLEVTGDLPRLAWHIGNRHTPCQIEPHRLLIRQDHVLEAMLRQLGATLRRTVEPFTPEGGAYGHGRTMGHDHGPEPTFAGFHHHGDGKMHFHAAPTATATAIFPLPPKVGGR